MKRVQTDTEHQPHPGPSIPTWWRAIMAREQAAHEAYLLSEAGRQASRARNDAVLEAMQAKQGLAVRGVVR